MRSNLLIILFFYHDSIPPLCTSMASLDAAGSDGDLFAVMLGRDDKSNRLRQSPPYVGLLPPEVVASLNEEAVG
jgi:hypothetical protein